MNHASILLLIAFIIIVLCTALGVLTLGMSYKPTIIEIPHNGHIYLKLKSTDRSFLHSPDCPCLKTNLYSKHEQTSIN